MIEFVIDNIFVMIDERVLKHTVGISMGKECVPLLSDLFLYSHETDFIQLLLKENERKIARFIF